MLVRRIWCPALYAFVTLAEAMLRVAIAFFIIRRFAVSLLSSICSKCPKCPKCPKCLPGSALLTSHGRPEMKSDFKGLIAYAYKDLKIKNRNLAIERQEACSEANQGQLGLPQPTGVVGWALINSPTTA